jgi:hypothetical protein
VRYIEDVLSSMEYSGPVRFFTNLLPVVIARRDASMRRRNVSLKLIKGVI